MRGVNDSRFGLQAGVFTNDLAHAWSAFEELEVGGVIVNDVPTYRIDHMPYGGSKDSGLGREGVRYAIEDMTESAHHGPGVAPVAGRPLAGRARPRAGTQPIRRPGVEQAQPSGG